MNIPHDSFFPDGEVLVDSGFFMSLPGFQPLHPALHGVLTIPLATNYYLSRWDEGKMTAKCLGAMPPLKTKLLSLTIAASGVQNVEPYFIDFHRLFVFVHTVQAYKRRAWVAVDGKVDGKQLIEKLRMQFRKDWPENHFKYFSAEQFEKYYPKEFDETVSKVLKMPHGLLKQDVKAKLAESVVNWSLANIDKAKVELAVCEKEPLEFLAEIEKKLV